MKLGFIEGEKARIFFGRAQSDEGDEVKLFQEHYTFEKNSQKSSIFCQAVGNPGPEITWTPIRVLQDAKKAKQFTRDSF